jgi:hypothetical protein
MLVLVGFAWAVSVLIWPGLALDDSAAGRDWQSGVATALATIIAGLLALLLTVGLVAVQMRSTFSWIVVRSIIDVSARTSLLAVTVAGVVLPLVVAARPSAAGTRYAFAGFGWALLLTATGVWVGMARTAPEWLVDRAVRRGLRVAGRKAWWFLPVRTRLAGRTNILVELAAGTGLPHGEHRWAVLAAVVMVAARARAGDRVEELTVAVYRLSRTALDGRAEPSIAQDTVAALAALGVDQAHAPAVHSAVRQALAGIAQRARSNGHRLLADHALEALVEVTQARLTLLLADQCQPALATSTYPRTPRGLVPEPPEPCGGTYQNAKPQPDVAATDQPTVGDTDGPVACSVSAGGLRAAEAADRRPSPGGRPDRSREVLGTGGLRKMVDVVADGQRLGSADVAAVLETLGPGRDEDQAEENDEHRKALAAHEAHDLLEDATGTLEALLAAPRPDSGGWPGGWQGHGALDQDVRRIGRLVLGAYERYQYPPTDTVEEALENLAATFVADQPPRVDLLDDHTGWRIIHSRNDTGPPIAVGETLRDLMVAAFAAGFDRRALLTGCRLMAAITAAARAGQVSAAVTVHRELGRAIPGMTRHQPDHSVAHQHRESTLLAGLIAELDPMLAACMSDHRLKGLIDEVSTTFAWSTNANPYPLAAAVWRAHLAAAGWPMPPLRSERGLRQARSTSLRCQRRWSSTPRRNCASHPLTAIPSTLRRSSSPCGRTPRPPNAWGIRPLRTGYVTYSASSWTSTTVLAHRTRRVRIGLPARTGRLPSRHCMLSCDGWPSQRCSGYHRLAPHGDPRRSRVGAAGSAPIFAGCLRPPASPTASTTGWAVSPKR